MTTVSNGHEMTAKEFAGLLRELGLSQMACARLLGVDGRTVRYWVSGKRPVPARFVKFLAQATIPPATALAESEEARPRGAPAPPVSLTARMIRAAYARGIPIGRIARSVGMTRQRVHQIAASPAEVSPRLAPQPLEGGDG